MSTANQSQQQQSQENTNFSMNGNDLSQPLHVRKISNEQLQHIRKISYENPGQLRKISYERSLKDPIEILKLNKKTRTKDQLQILCSYFKEFQNLKIIQNESYFQDKVGQLVDKGTYQKLNKGEFVFHNMDKNEFFYFILKGEVAAYAKKSEKNINRSPSPPIQIQQLGSQNSQSPISQNSQNGLQKINSSSQSSSNYQQLEKQASQNQSDSNPQSMVIKEDELELLRINNNKIGQYFEREGKGRAKYNRIQVYKERQSFGDLSKKFKTFSAVAKSDCVEVLKIANKDFTHIFDFFEKKLAMTIQILRKQFEGLVSDRILINLSYLFEDAGEVLTTGEYVYRESDIINKIFIVKEGHLDLVKRAKNIKNKYIEKKISILSTGELFGYESLQALQEVIKDDNGIQYTTEEDEVPQQKEDVLQHHKFSCKSTTENASIYWLDLNMLRRYDDYEDFLAELTRLGVKKSAYYEERLQKMLQVEEKQHSDQASLSPSKIRDQKLSFKEAVSGIFDRKSSNVFELGLSPMQQSLSHINEDLLGSPQLKKNKSSNKEKGDQSNQQFQFQRQSSILMQNSSSRNPSESFSPESSPPPRKNQTFNVLPYGNQSSVQIFAETIPERDELTTIPPNQIKLSLQKNRQLIDDNKISVQQFDQQSKYNLNNTRNSFSSTYEAGFQLKPIYSNLSSNNKQQFPISGAKLNSQINSPDKHRNISPFSSPIKLRTMRIYDHINQQDPKVIKGTTTEKDNLARRNNNSSKASTSTQLEDLYSKVNTNALRISSQDTPESFEKQMKQQIERKLQRQDSGRLLQRKRENELLNQNPSNIDVHDLQELLKIKEDYVQSKNMPKIVQLVSSGLPTFEESEKIQRILKKSKTKVINANISMNAVNNMTKNQSISPRQAKKMSANNSPNISLNNHSLNVSITKIMKNKMNGFSELNESLASQDKLSKNEINSPMKIKSFQKLNFFDEEDVAYGSQSSPNLVRIKYPNSRNSSPLTSLNQEDQEIQDDDSSSNIFKYTCESPKLKLQLRQATVDPSIDFQTIDSTKINQQGQESQEEIQNHSEIQDTILTLANKSSLSKGKFALKQQEPRYESAEGQSKLPSLPLPQIKNSVEERNIKNLTAKLQEATSGSPLKNVNLINSIGNRRYSSLGDQEILRNPKHSNNLFPNFLNNRVSIITSTGNAETQPSRNTRSSSGSQKRIKESTPLIVKPQSNDNIQTNATTNQIPHTSSRVTLQTGEKKNRKSVTLTFNQNLLKKSLIRQSLHKKYAQVISSSPFRDKVIVIRDSNDESQQNSQVQLGGINGQTINESSSSGIKSKRIKLNDLNSHFMIDKNNIFPTSLENSRTISSLLHNSNADNKLSNNSVHLQQTQTQKQLLLPQPKTISQAIRYNSCERLRNISSLHQFSSPDKFDQTIKNMSVSQFNNQSLSATTHTPDKQHLIPLQKHTNIITSFPARQATLQNLHTLISSQKKQDPSSSKNISQAQINSIRNGPLYQNINKILKPIQLSESTYREKKGFSLHSNY